MKKQGLNMSRFVKVQEDDKSAVMQHPNGHRITISKFALSPSLRKSLSELPLYSAEGTETPVPESMGPDVSMGNSAPPPVVVNVNNGPTAPQAPMQPPQAAVQPEPDSGMIPGRHLNPMIAGVAKGIAQVAADGGPGGYLGKKIVGGIGDAIFPKDEPQGLAPQADLTPSAPATPPAPPNPVFGDQQKALNSGQQLIGAELKFASEAQKAASEQAALYKADADAQANLLKSSELRYQEYRKERDNLVHDADNFHLKPATMFGNKTVPQQLFTAIGLVLGGMGGGILGQENPAMKFINQQMDRDTEAQKLEYQKIKDRMNNNEVAFQTERQWLDHQRLARLSVTESMIKQSAAKMGGAQAQLNAQRAIGALRQKQDALIIGMTAERLLSENQDPATQQKILMALRQRDPERAKDLEQNLVPGIGLASNATEAKEAKAAVTSYKNLTGLIEGMTKLRNEYGSEVLDRQAVAQGESMATDLLLEYKNLAQLGVLSKEDQKLLDRLIPKDPLQIEITGSTLVQLANLKKSVDSKFQNFMSARGLNRAAGGQGTRAGTGYVPKTFQPSR